MFCKKQNGQILLIVMLVVIVASTIGLSLASRSITSLRTSTEEAESQKALAAAEAGIERALQGSVPIATSSNSSSNTPGYTTQVDQVFGNNFLINGGNIITKDEGADLWLATYNSDPNLNYGAPWTGDLSIYWGDSSGDCKNAALEIIIVSGSKDDPTSKRYVFDSCSQRILQNGFAPPQSTTPENIVSNGITKTFPYGVTISVSDGLIARIIPIYGNVYAGVKGSSALPLQGYVITSIGTSGQANRKITVFKGYPQTYLPYLSYGLFVAN
jgi:hypothetical protein